MFKSNFFVRKKRTASGNVFHQKISKNRKRQSQVKDGCEIIEAEVNLEMKYLLIFSPFFL
jgi:hypothetical protein